MKPLLFDWLMSMTPVSHAVRELAARFRKPSAAELLANFQMTWGFSW